MKDLYLRLENENVQISQDQINKYNLKVGDLSPFNSYQIVDKFGNDTAPKEKKTTKYNPDELMSDGVIFTQSESIDIAQGVDSNL